MYKRTLRIGLIAAAVLAVTGCSQMEAIGIHMPNSRAEYESSNSRAPLDIPPDLDTLNGTDRYVIPEHPTIVSAKAESERLAKEAEKRGEVVADVLPVTEYAKVIQDGQMRYVHVTAKPERVWNLMKDFWSAVGLTVKTSNAKTGTMQTEWAENKANLPKDFIRGALGKVFDFMYDTGLRDQYRSRMERNADGTTNIFISHRQMVEVLKGQQQDTTIWQPGPTDPQLEAEMLQRLAMYLDQKLNPNAKIVEQKQVEALAEIKYTPVSSVVKSEDGQVIGLEISEPFDRAWRRVGLALDRAGFDIVDRDRSQGLVIIKYLDADYEAKKKSEQGFMSNLFSKTKPVDPVEFQVRLVPNDSGTRLSVYGAEGKADTTGVASKIVELIAEQAR